MSYDDTVQYLFNLQKYGIKFGLDNIKRLMSALGDPHKSFLSVHVAGTNGKGSTAAIIASVLKSSGFKVGLFTSPHLVSFTERIRTNGSEITENDVVTLAEEIREFVSGIEDFSPTFFEVVTAMAMLYFKREKIDIAVIEVGMGGRLDATNIILPEVSVITGISHDHKDFLGDTLKEIAREKAGIIKENIPVVMSSQTSEVMQIIENKTVESNSGLFSYGKDFSSALNEETISGIRFDYYENGTPVIRDLFLPLTGDHQMQNASVAIKAAIILLMRRWENVSANAIHQFIRDGLNNVTWPGRLEFIHEDPPVVIDGAHNPAAATALSAALKNVFLKKYKTIILILGIMADKDLSGTMGPLLPLASEIIFTSPAYSRAASPEQLAQVAGSLGFNNFRIEPSVKDALVTAMKKRDSLIVVTGSFYTIGEAREALGKKGILTGLRE
jgi:dihydrofolate synthase / folylpolyglutamate synthase